MKRSSIFLVTMKPPVMLIAELPVAVAAIASQEKASSVGVAAPSRRDQRSNPSAEAIACSARQSHTIANELIGGHDGDERWLAKCLRDLAKLVAAKREERASILKQQERAIRRERQVARDLGSYVLPESEARTRGKKVDYSDMGNG